MYGFRSVSRYIGFGLCAGCVLAPVSALAAWNPDNVTILSKPTSTAISGNYIEANVSARYSHMPGRHRVYTKLPVAVPKATLRVGALASLSRGVMHPGFQVALLAAGLLFDSESGELKAIPNNDELIENYHDPYLTSGYDYRLDYPYNSYWADSPLQAIIGYLESEPDVSFVSFSGTYPSIHAVKLSYNGSIYNKNILRRSDPDNANVSTISPDNDSLLDSSPATESDLAALDQHIPPELLTQMYDRTGSIVDIPPWESEITVMGMSGAETSGNVPPEIMLEAKKWSQNMAAQFDGEPEPNPDQTSDGKTASEAAYEQSLEDKSEPVPPFADVEAEWQVETIDSLPDFNSGIGSGSCPAPWSFTYQGMQIEWSYEPACDFATMLRPFVIGVCFLLALYIVLGVSRGNE